MKRYLKTAVYAAALLLGGVSANAVLSVANAQEDVAVNFDSFHDQLASYGDWVYSDRWGEVWIPADVSDDFHPYGTDGRWVYTQDYGWTWASDYEWGDIPFHYGRWVNDPDDGWLWIPGYVWSPGWVVWRHNGRYTGWMPMPPNDEFLGRGPSTSIGISLGGLSISFNSTDDDYGYSRWYGSGYGRDRFASNWIFIGTGHIADRDYRRYEAPRNDYTTIIHNTTNVTNYTVVNNYVVNKSVDPDMVRRAGGHVQAVKIADVVKKPQLITRADTGNQFQQRARRERPRGTGVVNSAPKPTATQIQSLSTKTPPRMHRAGPPAHLFTRDTVTKAPLAPRPAGAGASPAATEAPKPVTPAERKDIKRGILPTTEAPKPEVKTPPAMEGRVPGTVTPKETSTLPAQAPREKKSRERTPSAENTMAPTPPVETPRENHVRDRMTPPVTAPAEVPRERVERPATEAAPAAAPATEMPRALHHVPKTEVPATTTRPVAPVEHPAVVHPRPPAEAHAPVEPKEKKAPPKKPKHDEPGDEH